MTIDQWIIEAECAASNAAHCLKREVPDLTLAVAWAAVSQAAAATARAMILAQATSENAEGTRRWLRVDTGA